MVARVKVRVEGTAARIDALFRFDKAAWKALRDGVKTATDKITDDARQRVPSMGLIPMAGGKGWGPWRSKRDGRDLGYNKSAFRFKTSTRSRLRPGGFREVSGFSLLDKSTPSVAIFVLAGSQNSSGHPFNRNINKQTGTVERARNAQMWPRIMTPAYYAKRDEAAKEIGRLIETAVADANK